MMIDFTRVDVNIPKLSMHHSDKHQNTPILRKDNYIELFCNVFPHLIGICPTLSTFLVSLCLFQYIINTYNTLKFGQNNIYCFLNTLQIISVLMMPFFLVIVVIACCDELRALECGQ